MSEITYKVNITLTSVAADEDVMLTVSFDPNTSGKDIEELGYLPAAYGFFDKFVVPMLEEAFGEEDDAPTLN